MLPSPSATSGGQGILPTPGSTAGTKRPATSDLHRAVGATSTPTKRHATKGSVGSAAGAGLAGASIMQTPTTAPPAPPPPPPPPPASSSVPSPACPGAWPCSCARAPDACRHHRRSAGGQDPRATHGDHPPGPEPASAIRRKHIGAQPGRLLQWPGGRTSSRYRTSTVLAPKPIWGDHTRLPRVPVAPAPPPIAPQAPQSSPPRPPASMTNRPTRPPPQSPLQTHSDARLLPKQSSAQAPQTPGPPAYDYRTVGTVEEVWKEYREGMDGQPAIEELDATWGSRWRPEPRGRTWYSRRKVIWDKIKDFIAEGMEEDEAVKEVEKLRDGGTINKLIRMLQEERKDKGLPDDSLTT
ncbi:hypothetical protein PG993_004360 [Apiospora rasikravindrae]|uniref:Transcription activator GCR1-like domain-containing protein n=1 Tax=Apiospora rasikravindrae TaxID=990691 RepID=A0ABR1TCJ2_9PEZI